MNIDFQVAMYMYVLQNDVDLTCPCRVYLDLTSLYTDLISFDHLRSFLLLEAFLFTLTLEVYPCFKVGITTCSLIP